MIRDHLHHDVKESIILSGQGFIGSFDDPSNLSEITVPDPGHPKETYNYRGW